MVNAPVVVKPHELSEQDVARWQLLAAGLDEIIGRLERIEQQLNELMLPPRRRRSGG